MKRSVVTVPLHEVNLENVAQMPQVPGHNAANVIICKSEKKKREIIKCLNIQWAPSTQTLQTFYSTPELTILQTTQTGEVAKQTTYSGAFFFLVSMSVKTDFLGTKHSSEKLLRLAL